MNVVPRIDVVDLGRADYEATLAFQRRLVEDRAAARVIDTLVFVEHPPVITLGRRRGADAHVLAAAETPVVTVERGGDVTWHGPGQLVGYPILLLGPGERDVHAVLRRLEGALIAALAELGLPGERREGFTGVWCRGRKLVSVGVAIRHWVTFHGFALNVDPDLGEFARVHPCGLDASVMGSVVSIGGSAPERRELVRVIAAAIGSAFGRLTGDARALTIDAAGQPIP